jgi:hypothetical protein
VFLNGVLHASVTFAVFLDGVLHAFVTFAVFLDGVLHAFVTSAVFLDGVLHAFVTSAALFHVTIFRSPRLLPHYKCKTNISTSEMIRCVIFLAS